jgi:hypothetical protein
MLFQSQISTPLHLKYHTHAQTRTPIARTHEPHHGHQLLHRYVLVQYLRVCVCVFVCASASSELADTIPYPRSTN